MKYFWVGCLARLTAERPLNWHAGCSRLDPTEEEQRQTLGILLRLLVEQGCSREAAWLADGVIQADPSPEEKRRTRDALLRLLAGQRHGREAIRLASRLSRFDPTPDDKRSIRRTLLRFLADPLGGSHNRVARGLDEQPDWTPLRKTNARPATALLKLLADQTDGQTTKDLAGWVSRLDPTAEDKRQTRDCAAEACWSTAPTTHWPLDCWTGCSRSPQRRTTSARPVTLC